MREEIAKLVYPVLKCGIDFKEGLDSNDPPDFSRAQRTLLGLLQIPTGERDFIGDGQINPDDGGGRTDFFLGIRYALVCWLDEIFITDSPWKIEWSDKSLERALYHSRVRAFNFWEQARKAETRPGGDALEAFYLCVLLGFRGDLESKPDELKHWRSTTEAQLREGQDAEFPLPPARMPTTNVPPLTGSAQLQRMALIAGLALLIMIPIAVFLLISSLPG